MSISTNPVITTDVMPHNQSIVKQPSGSNAQRAVFNSSAAADAAEVKKNDAADAAKPSAEQTRKSLQEINQVLAGLSVSVQFQIDPDIKDVIVKVIDKDSGKVIRQMPSEDVVRLSKAMDNLKGLLFEQTV